MSLTSDPFAAYLRDLSNPNPGVQKTAIKAMTALGDKRSVSVFIQILDAKEASVRAQAVLGLAKYRHPESIEPLIEVAQKDCLMVRRKAVAALALFSDPRIAPVLVRTLSDPDPKLTEIAAKALGKRGDRVAVPALMALVEDAARTAPKVQWAARRAYSRAREVAVAALGTLGDPRAIPTLIRSLGDEDGVVQDTAIRMLAGFGEDAVLEVVAALDSENELIRFAAVQILDAMRCKSAVMAVIPLLKDPDARVRGFAARYLGRSGDPQVIPALVEAIETTADEGPNALLALGEAGREAIRGVLAHNPVRTYSILVSIRSLKDRDTRFVPPIIGLLKSGVVETRIGATKMLAYFKDEQAVLPLIEALQDADKLVRQEVVLALGQLGDAWAVDPLIVALNDSEWGIRCRAIDALAALGGPHLVEPLIQKLDRAADAAERRLAARRLGDLGDTRAIEPLLVIANNPEDEIADSFPVALGKLGDRRAVTPLLRILCYSDDRVLRKEAAESLGKLGDSSVVTPIITLLQQLPLHSAELVLALGALGDQAAVEPVVEALERGLNPTEENPRARFQKENLAAEEPFISLKERVCLEEYGLEALGKLKATVALVTYLKHQSSRVRRCAADALGEARTANDQVIQALEATLEDIEPAVRAAAKYAIIKLT